MAVLSDIDGGILSSFFLPVLAHVACQLEKRPALRALERVVSEEGLKTVITLRLAPVLPIPLGAYNYGKSVPGVEFRCFNARVCDHDSTTPMIYVPISMISSVKHV